MSDMHKVYRHLFGLHTLNINKSDSSILLNGNLDVSGTLTVATDANVNTPYIVTTQISEAPFIEEGLLLPENFAGDAFQTRRHA